MQLLRLDEAPIGERDQVFRYSRARALFTVFALLGASAGLIAFGWVRHAWIAHYIAAVILLGLAVMHRFVSARFLPSNWLARIADDGLYIQIRSYLNHRFPREDRTVVCIPFAEIRSLRLVRERSEIPIRDGPGSTTDRVDERRHRLIEIDLAGDTEPLAHALSEEASRCGLGAREQAFSGTRYRHTPARMSSPGHLRLEWGVVPGPRAFLDAMAQRSTVADSVEERQDFVHLRDSSREEQEKRILQLAESGDFIAAITIARDLYSLDPTQAKARVEDLLRARTTGTGLAPRDGSSKR